MIPVPSVSVVIPVHNQERYLAECLDSVIAQTFADIEIVCVDDGSTDGSHAILARYAERDPRFRIVEQENQGLSGARNSGLDVATGEFVLFLDSDDWIDPTAVAEIFDACHRDNADIGIFRIRYVYTGRGISRDADWSLRTDLVPDTLPFSHRELAGSIFALTTPCVWNKLFRRSFIAESGLRFSTDLERAEDLPFTYPALVRADRITIVDRPLVNYRTELDDSRQATVHEWPLDICDSLLSAKNDLSTAGLFDEVERDFVNEALSQCLFSLDTYRTFEAFTELYDAIKLRYAAELGIKGRAPEYFRIAGDYERYTRIEELPPAAFLFEETLALRADLIHRLDDVRALRNRLNEALAEGRVLREEVAELTRELSAAESELRHTRSELDSASAAIDRIERSRSYRLARRLAGISKGFTRIIPTSRAKG